MPRFTYKARDNQDRIVAGTVDGAHVDDVIEKLNERSLVPITVDELNFDGTRKNQSFIEKFKEGLVKARNKVPYRAVVFFTRQLATMIEGGVPLARSLEQLARSEKPTFKKIILQIGEDISIGFSFSDAVARHPGAFNNMYVSVIRSGEVAGALDQVLNQLADYMENVEAMKSKVKAAMRYPGFIAGFVVILVTGILWKLVPVFEGLYSGFGAKLPLPTQILVTISHLIRDNVPLVIIGIAALIAGYRAAMTNDEFKKIIHLYILKFPVFGEILRKNILATFCRTMALLMESGTPILQATEISGAVVGNKVYALALETVYGDLRQGELLSSSLAKSGQFPVLIQQLVSTGEESGKVDELLRKAAEFYEREIKNVVDSLAAIIEPFLIIVLGGLVGSILIALYMPVFMIGKLVGTH
jgi:type IV pilus assembly protein PilC